MRKDLYYKNNLWHCHVFGRIMV